MSIPALIAAYPWPVSEATAVMMCESGGDPNAYSDGNYGLLQLNEVHAWRVGGDATAFFDPATNIRVASELWADQGWDPWRWSRGCHGY